MPVALIETIRIRAGVAPLFGLHLNRLALSCKALGIPFPGRLDIPAGGQDRVHRLEVSRKGVTESERELGSEKPARIVTARVRHEPYPHKTTDRHVFDEAAAEARGVGADEAILLTKGEGYVAEGSVWGVFWWEDGRLCAPALDLGILPGVARARLTELAGGIRERRVQPAALRGASVFLANAARGVVLVAEWDGHLVPKSAATQELAERFWP